jgi:hypothetical protein
MSIVRRFLHMPERIGSIIDQVVKDFRFHDTPDVLRVPLGPGDTTLEFVHIVPSWGPGVIVEIDTELILVLDVNETSHAANVVRGWLNTTATDHAVNSPIFLAPRVFRSDVLNLISECLTDIYPRLFRVRQTDLLNYNGGIIGYELPEDAGDVLSVQVEWSGRASGWEYLADWEFISSGDPSVFPSGKSLQVRASLPSGARILTTYSAPFGPIVQTMPNIEDDYLGAAEYGLRPYMFDLPFYYAMSRLMIDEEKQRSQIDAAHAHQRSADVPAFLALRTGEWYKARYEERVLSCMWTQGSEARRVRLAGYGS